MSGATRASAVAVVVLAACAGAAEPPSPAPGPMPELRVQQRAGAEEPEPLRMELQVPTEGRVTLTATNADVRVILPLLAEAAGVSLLVEPDVQGTVSVHFEDVPALDALRETLDQAGLVVVTSLRPPGGPTVFYTVPVNLNEATVAEIRARFGVSEELARFIVRTRVPPER